MKINKIFLLSLISLLPISACTPPTPPEAPETVIETTNPDDKYKVSVDVSQIDKNDKNESSGNLENGKNGGDLVNAEETKGDDRPAWEIEESMAEEMQESMEAEREESYQEYLESDEQSEIYLIYKNDDGTYLNFTEDVAEGAEYEPRNYKIAKSSIQGDTAQMKEGDVARIEFNGAINEDNELVKVYGIYNYTEELVKEMEEADAEAEAEEVHNPKGGAGGNSDNPDTAN